MKAPVNWDGVSYCVEEDCEQPAAHYRLIPDLGPDEFPVSEAVCCEHSLVEVAEDEPAS